jgi:ketosteroid isomerase-like protein
VSDEPESVARAYIDASNSGDLDAVLALLDPEIEMHESEALPGPVSAVGFDAVRRYLERFDTHWSSFHWEPLEWRVSKERVLCRARLALTGRKSGIDVDREWIYVFTVRDGKLLRQQGFDDMAVAMQSLEADS